MVRFLPVLCYNVLIANAVNISGSRGAEITNTSSFGIYFLALAGNEYFVRYSEYPVFKSAAIKDIADIQSDALGNLHWIALDTDIELEALRCPQRFPLQYL